MRLRSWLLPVLALAAIPAPATAGTAPAVLEIRIPALAYEPGAGTDSAHCGGTAPVTTACTTTGVFGSTARVALVPAVGTTGTMSVSVTSATMTFSFSATFVAGQVFSQTPPVQTGGFIPGQTYTLSGSMFGVGIWQVRVDP